MTAPTIIYPQPTVIVQQDGRPLEQNRYHWHWNSFLLSSFGVNMPWFLWFFSQAAQSQSSADQELIWRTHHNSRWENPWILYGERSVFLKQNNDQNSAVKLRDHEKRRNTSTKFGHQSPVRQNLSACSPTCFKCICCLEHYLFSSLPISWRERERDTGKYLLCQSSSADLLVDIHPWIFI